MSEITCISHPKRIYIDSWSAAGHSQENSGRVLSWNSGDLASPTLISCTAAFHNLCSFNSISVGTHPEHDAFFPSRLRFEVSSDAQVWEPLLHEVNYRVGPHKKGFWNFALTSARYLKFVFLADKKNAAGSYTAAFGELQILISGAVAITSSSELDRLWVKENIIDRRPEYGWSTAPRTRIEKEFIQIDMGSINRLCEMRLLSKDDSDTFFPASFQLLYSENNISWHLLFEENGFLAESACWYRWRFLAVNARYVRLVITAGALTHEGKYISQIIEMELYAAADLLARTGGSDSAPPPASTLRSGIVRLALDGEDKEGIAVQGNDRRLLDATSARKGIVELASDGEETEGIAVQAADRRLKYATEDRSGIVRLARDEEVREGHVLQSNDSRLKLAEEKSVGLVKLAVDGETRSGTAVQGNDKRLRYAQTKSPGIVRLAGNGSDQPNAVVQADDARLRKADSENYGIVRFSQHSEKAAMTAVQSNDPRLQQASVGSKGIVELSADGDKKGGRAVQGNDSRLDKASENNFGLTRLAPIGTAAEGSVVQAQDPRLSNARHPLDHEHNYAPKNHEFNSHSGSLRVEQNEGEAVKGINVPPKNHAPITGINQGEGAGIAGQGKKDGVFGSGGGSGLFGLGIQDGCGILAAARNNAAGVFLSENSYSIIAGGDASERGIHSSELALLAKGISRFDGSLYSYAGLGSLASYFPVKEKESIAPGELAAIGEKGRGVYRPQSYGSLRLIGVCVSQAAFVVNLPPDFLPASAQEGKGPFTFPPLPGMALIAIGGIVEVRADATRRPIAAGDLLVSSMELGKAEALDQERYRPGMVFARSLTDLEQGMDTVKAVITSF